MRYSKKIYHKENRCQRIRNKSQPKARNCQSGKNEIKNIFKKKLKKRRNVPKKKLVKKKNKYQSLLKALKKCQNGKNNTASI